MMRAISNVTLSVILTTLLIISTTSKSQVTYTFTNCGATGSVGPTQTQVTNTYSSTNLAGSVSASLGIQSWTVPSSGNYRILAAGAAGGTQLYFPGYPGGKGASMQGEFTFTVGTVLNIIVGQKGEDTRVSTQDNAAPGGGGGSFVYTSPSASVPLIAAGGGAGGGRNPGFIHASISTSAYAATFGGAGGSGGNGGGANTNGASYWAGGGAGWLSDGTGGNNSITYNYFPGSQGAYGGRRPANGASGGIRWNDGFDEGGDGGFGGGGGGGSDNMGTGGGGGYSGGGGANSGTNFLNHTGGGGGSYNGGLNQVNTASVNMGHGYVIISKLQGIDITQTAPISCYGQTTAVLSATASGGTAPYSYIWSPGGVTTSTFGPIPAGVYTCTAIDANSLVLTGTFQVTSPPDLLTSITQINPTCNGASNGSATLTATGGVPSYNYTWIPSGGSGSIATGLTAGTYSILVSDLNNCVKSTTLALTQPPPVSVVGFAINSVVCAGQTTTLIAGGALTYTWTGGVINGVSFTPTASTNYTVFGTTSSGCTGSGTVSVTVNPLPNVVITGNGGFCAGNPTVLLATGANSYTWSTGAFTSSTMISPSVNTIYTVTGTNSFGCSNTAARTITVFPLPNVTATISSQLVCSGYPVMLLAGGASTYTWTGGVVNGVPFYPTASNTYTVYGTDGNGCTNFATRSLSTAPLPSVTISGQTITCAGAPLTLTASGASSYTWITGSNSPTMNLSLSTNTLISVAGTGTNGCIKTVYHPVFYYSLPNISISSTSSVVCGGAQLLMTASGGSSYTWTPGGMTVPIVTVSPIQATTYTLTGLDQFGCKNTSTIFISTFAQPTVSISGPTLICAGNTTSFTANGATSYTWNNSIPGNSISVNPMTTALYQVTGIDNNGCFGSASLTVFAEMYPVLSVVATSTLICRGNTTHLLGTGASSYTWLPGNINSAISAVSPSVTSTYSLSGSSLGGCTSYTTFQVSVQQLPVLTVSNGSVCSGGNIIMTAAGAQSYTWVNNGINSPSITVNPASNTTFTVSGSDNLGCKSTGYGSVTVYPLPVLSISGATRTCAGTTLVLSASGASTYSWSTIGAASQVTVTPTVTTTYTLVGTGVAGCTSTISHQVISDPSPLISISASQSLTCAGESVTLYASGANLFNWNTGSIGPLLVTGPTVTTVYSVTGMLNNGCSNSITYTHTVSECTDLKQDSQFGLEIYPNPTTGPVKIKLITDAHLTIRNALGQIIVSYRMTPDTNELDLTDLLPGIFWMTFETADASLTKKLIISR